MRFSIIKHLAIGVPLWLRNPPQMRCKVADLWRWNVLSAFLDHFLRKTLNLRSWRKKHCRGSYKESQRNKTKLHVWVWSLQPSRYADHFLSRLRFWSYLAKCLGEKIGMQARYDGHPWDQSHGTWQKHRIAVFIEVMGFGYVWYLAASIALSVTVTHSLPLIISPSLFL